MKKAHKKLYKAGKRWLTAMITIGAVTVLGGMATAHADLQATTSAPQTAVVQAQTDTVPQEEQQDQASQEEQATAKADQTVQGETTAAMSQTTTATSGLTVSHPQANAANQWVHYDQGWSYTDSQGNWVYSQWQHNNNNWYYFNDAGYAQTGWLKTTVGNWYYFDNQNAWALKGWQYLDNSWYYFDLNQANALTGWQWIDNNWYYFDAANRGQMKVGWQKINQKTYYLNEQHDGTYGAMKTGWQWLNGRWYFLNGDGAAAFGWNAIGGNEYYFDPQTAQMATGDTVIDGYHFYFDPASGHQLRGLVLNPTSHKLMYYDENTGSRQSQLTTEGRTLNFDPTTGDLDTTGWASSLVKLNGYSYYYDAASGRFSSNDWRQLNDHWYYFGDQAAATTGWYRSAAGKWYYFAADGTATTGWFKSPAGNWFYFDPTNAWAQTGWFKSAAGNWYYFDPTNAWALKGWQRINNNWYYFDTDQTWALKDWQLINGTWYYFDPQNCWLDYQPTLNYAWRSIINQYSNPVAIAIQSQATNQVYTYTNVAGHTFDTASTVKVAVLAELLHNTGGSLTWQQQQLATKMIRNSDNDATTYIVNNYLGGLGGLRSLYSALGMNSTSIGPTWGTTKTTPADQLKLLDEIYLKPSSTYLNNQSRQYIRQLMGSVSASQNWGISAGSGSFYVKNGWRPDDGWWHVNSIGFIPGSQNDGYTIAVYTDSNTSMNNGINLIERLARATRTIMI